MLCNKATCEAEARRVKLVAKIVNPRPLWRGLLHLLSTEHVLHGPMRLQRYVWCRLGAKLPEKMQRWWIHSNLIGPGLASESPGCSGSWVCKHSILGLFACSEC